MPFVYQIIRSTLILCACICFATCGNGDSTAETTTYEDAAPVALPMDFIQFYTRFHADSAFQMAHITFPLEGIAANSDTSETDGEFRWLSTEWTLHKPLQNEDNLFEQNFSVLGKGLIVETIRSREMPLAMQRRFAQMSDGWHLIYYTEMQPMQ